MIKIPKIRLNLITKYSNKNIFNPGVIIEVRFPKVKFDDTKVFGTTKSHKYY